MQRDLSDSLQEQVAEARNDETALRITSGNSKAFYGHHIDAREINLREHTGIIEYQPSELVVTVRSGTKLSELEEELKSRDQMLAFEPPQHDENSTIGGIIACGMSGPRRIACGSARDFVLGTTIINGKAEKLHFGGQVIKNVAGYDASRLMVGAQGTLGLLLDISLKTLPLSEAETSLKLSLNRHDAVKNLRHWKRQGLPLSASCHYKNTLYLRLSSTASAVKQSHKTITDSYSTEKIGPDFWLEVKNQKHLFFRGTENIWRFSHLSATRLLDDYEDQLIEWNGSLCWVKSDSELHSLAEEHEANATRYPINPANKQVSPELFQPLESGLFKIHKRLKQAFDPDNILNPGRTYANL